MNYKTDFDAHENNYIISSDEEKLNIIISKVRYKKLHKEGNIHKTILGIFNFLNEYECTTGIVTRVSNDGKCSVEIEREKKPIDPVLARKRIKLVKEAFDAS